MSFWSRVRSPRRKQQHTPATPKNVRAKRLRGDAASSTPYYTPTYSADSENSAPNSLKENGAGGSSKSTSTAKAAAQPMYVEYPQLAQLTSRRDSPPSQRKPRSPGDAHLQEKIAWLQDVQQMLSAECEELRSLLARAAQLGQRVDTVPLVDDFDALQREREELVRMKQELDRRESAVARREERVQRAEERLKEAVLAERARRGARSPLSAKSPSASTPQAAARAARQYDHSPPTRSTANSSQRAKSAQRTPSLKSPSAASAEAPSDATPAGGERLKHLTKERPAQRQKRPPTSSVARARNDRAPVVTAAAPPSSSRHADDEQQRAKALSRAGNVIQLRVRHLMSKHTAEPGIVSAAAAGGARGLPRATSSSKTAALLSWCKSKCTYRDVFVKDFTESWRDGVAFCALLFAIVDEKQISISWNDVQAFSSPIKRLEWVFDEFAALKKVPKLIDAADVADVCERLSIITYLSEVYRAAEPAKAGKRL